MKISKLLIANRGEISIRIAKTAKKLGIKTVSVFTPLDIQALHPTKTDQSIQISNYLDFNEIIDVSKLFSEYGKFGFWFKSCTFISVA